MYAREGLDDVPPEAGHPGGGRETSQRRHAHVRLLVAQRQPRGRGRQPALGQQLLEGDVFCESETVL